MARTRTAKFLKNPVAAVSLVVVLVSVITTAVLTQKVQEEQGIGSKAAMQSCVFLKEWKNPGSGSGQLDYPADVAAVSSGTDVFVSDMDNNKIIKYSSEGIFKKEWGGLGTGNGQFDHPKGMAVSGTNLYVTDQYNNRIQVFDTNGNFKFKFGSGGSRNGQFNKPGDVAVDLVRGYIYVADSNNSRIQKFDSTGRFLLKWGSSGSRTGQFKTPTGVAVDYKGDVYVADYLNNRVQKFTDRGKFIAQWTGLQMPADVDVKQGYVCSPPCPADPMIECYSGACNPRKAYEGVYVTELQTSRLLKYDTNGKLLAVYDKKGGGQGQIAGIMGTGADVSDNVFVADATNQKILKFTCISWINPPTVTPSVQPTPGGCSPSCNVGWWCSAEDCCRCAYGDNPGGFGPVTCCDPPGGGSGCSTWNINGCNPAPTNPPPTPSLPPGSCYPACTSGWWCSAGDCCRCNYGDNPSGYGPVTCCNPPGSAGGGCSTYNVYGCNPLQPTPSIPPVTPTPAPTCVGPQPICIDCVACVGGRWTCISCNNY